MNISRFFIDRPIFAAVIAVVISIIGIAAYPLLPLSQYPGVGSRMRERLAAAGVTDTAGLWNMTTREARGTPAIPLEVTISSSSMVICWAMESSMPS